jgi:hypothetical protein
MIRYALACDKAHTFESWFRDSGSFDDQVARGLVSCPFCGSTRVEKQIMAPSVARTGRDASSGPAGEIEDGRPATTLPAPAPAPPASAPMALMGEREQAFRALLRAVRQHVVDTAEHVGPRFAEEARRMHDGVADFRAIYGEATPEEVAELAEDGIDALQLPWIPDDRN